MDLVYIWQDASGIFRSKVRRLENPNFQHSINVINVDKYNRPTSSYKTGTTHYQIPTWNYDGSSTGQASTEHSEVLLEPYKFYTNVEEHRIYVLCSTYTPDHIPVPPNNWHMLKEYDEAISQTGLKLGFEQEFFVFDSRTKRAFFESAFLQDILQGPFYCSVGCQPRTIISRKLEEIVREVYERACKLGVKCTGYNLEVAPAQAEIQVCDYAINACHDLIFLRYLLWDTLAKYSCYPVFDPKPLGSNYNGSGLHTNVSNVFTMSPGGYELIQRVLKRLEETHSEHLEVYGEGNEKRLTGYYETSSMEKFTWGVGSRNTSVRIPHDTAKNGCGYFEDRRPAANADPYLVCLRMWKSMTSIV